MNFQRYFRTFHKFLKDAELLCLRRGLHRTLAHLLDEWALENMRSGLFTEVVHCRAGVEPLSQELAVLEEDLRQHQEM